MVWFYTFFCYLFGGSALLTIRIFTCFYIYLTAIYFNGFLVRFKPFKHYLGLPSILFVLLVSIPWYTQQMSASLFVLLPILIAFHIITELGEDKRTNYRLMFRAGLWLMISIMASYKIIFLLLGVILAYLILANPRLDELMSMIGGLLTVLMLVLVSLFMTGSLPYAWDQGVLYYLDRLGLAGTEVYVFEPLKTLGIWSMIWAVFLFLAIWGFFHFRLRFYSYKAQIRSGEMTMAIWLVGSLMMLSFKFNRLELSDLILMVPPLVFYASKTLDFKWVYRMRIPILLVSLIMPIYTYLGYWGMVFPNSFALFTPRPSQVYLHGGSKMFLEKQLPVFSLESENTDLGIWVMDAQPEWYHLLGRTCANKYTDYRMVYFKFPHLAGKDVSLTSAKEHEKEIFQQFSQHPPAFILDPNNHFKYIKKRFPRIFQMYKQEKKGDFLVYMRQN